LDNTFASRPTVTKGPVVRLRPPAPGSLLTVGNIFTVPHAVAVKGQHFELDDRVAARETLKPAIPEFVGVAPRSERLVVEVRAGSSGAEIQLAVDDAANKARVLGGAIVHLPAAEYSIDRPLILPENVPVALVGDGYDSVLRWTGRAGAGPVLRLRGPSRARLRDFLVSGPKMVKRVAISPLVDTAIVVEDADQQGGQIGVWLTRAFGEENGMLVDGLDQTHVHLVGFEGGPALDGNAAASAATKNSLAPYPAIRVFGGSKSLAGKSTNPVVLDGGNTGRFDVANGGALIARDCWYEHNNYPIFALLHGTGDLVLDCGRIARPPERLTGPALILDDFHGRVTVLNVNGSDNEKRPLLGFRGDCTGAKVLVLGYDARGSHYMPDPKDSHGARFAWIICRLHPNAIDDSAGVDKAFVREMLALDRRPSVGLIDEIPRGATDLQIRRVATEKAKTGILIKAAH
ncbi:MAG: hypothetical protein ACRD36_05635, partial [Candidatus Acidiferrum sp.]